MTVSCETACTLVRGDTGICLYNGDMALGRWGGGGGWPRIEKHYCLVWFFIF